MRVSKKFERKFISFAEKMYNKGVFSFVIKYISKQGAQEELTVEGDCSIHYKGVRVFDGTCAEDCIRFLFHALSFEEMRSARFTSLF